MPVTIRFITIHAPRQRVWDVLVDVPAQPRWMHDLKSLALDPPGLPVRVGTRAVGTVRMFGVTQSDPIEITDLRAPERYAIRHHGRFVGRGAFDLAPLRGERSTRVLWREELFLDPRSLGLPRSLQRLVTRLARLVDPLLRPVFALVFRADLRRLRTLVASQEPRHGTETPSATSGPA